MSLPHQIQRSLVSIFASTVVYAVFFVLMAGATTIQQWATGFLLLIAAYVLVLVAVYVISALVRAIVFGTQESEVTDELERVIGLTAARNAGVATALALVGFMVVAASGGTISTMFTVLVVGQWLAGLVHDGTRIVLYRRGF